MYYLNMTPQKREFILRIADGNTQNFPILHQLDGFVHAERMFAWLIRNGITGQKFFDLYVHEFKCSWLTFGKWLVMKINNEVKMTEVIAGKDYINRG